MNLGRAGAAGGPLAVLTTGLLEDGQGVRTAVTADLVYVPSDCLAVTLVLVGADSVPVRWAFAWDLLERGMAAPVGQGDVRVSPTGSTAIEVVLVSHSTVRIRLPRGDVRRFVRMVLNAVQADARRIASALEVELASIVDLP